MRKRWSAAIATGAIAAMIAVMTGTVQATPAGTVDYTTTNSVAVQAMGTDLASIPAGGTIKLGARFTSVIARSAEVRFAVRGPSSTNHDTPITAYSMVTSLQNFEANLVAPSTTGTYTWWFEWRNAGTTNWTTEDPTRTFSVTAPAGAPATPTIISQSVTPNPATTGQTVTASAQVWAQPQTVTTLVWACRTPTNGNCDFGHSPNFAFNGSPQTFSGSRSFTTAGTYTLWVAYQNASGWHDLTPSVSLVVTTGTPPPSGSEQPVGGGTGWTREFTDDFGTLSADTNGGGSARWYARNTSAESDDSSPAGTGNKGNQQLEFDRLSNCSVTDGVLDIAAQRTNVTTPEGGTYNWTSCMLTTNESFQYGFIEARMDLPSLRGFWPAFWTWQAPGVNTWNETDVFEFYSDNHNRLYHSQHAQGGGSCVTDMTNPPTGLTPFDPSTGFHVYGANIQPSGTDFYLDGVLVCSVDETSVAQSQLILDMFVYSTIPPLASTNSEHTYVDYVRAWT